LATSLARSASASALAAAWPASSAFDLALSILHQTTSKQLAAVTAATARIAAACDPSLARAFHSASNKPTAVNKNMFTAHELN